MRRTKKIPQAVRKENLPCNRGDVRICQVCQYNDDCPHRDKKVFVDTAFGHDYTGLTTIDTQKGTIENRIIRTDNPDMNSWLYGFLEDSKIINNEMQNK